MRKIAIALLATTVIGTSAFAAPDSNQSRNMQKQPQNQAQQNYQGGTSQNASGQQQTAQEGQTISAQDLSRDKVRQVQQALDKDGFNVGRPDGRWGPRTENAVKKFQQSKQIQANGQLDQQTIADLGLDQSSFSQQKGGQR